MTPSKRSSMKRALLARDDGLRKVSAATRALVVGAVAGTGLFTVLAAAQPGHTKVRAARQSQVVAPANAVANDAGTGDDTNLSPPAALPAPSYQYSSPAVVSGAS
jgi:hypothetical protein